ncbi:MAG: response regulator transcription factor [Acidimicrobiia bacterium]
MGSAGQGRASRVLVVDDEDNITFLLGSALRHFGYEVAEVGNGRSALEAVGSFVPDLVLLDVMLPDLDGFEVCRRMRQEGAEMPVLFLTARGATEDMVRGLTVGGDDYVAKPFRLEEIMARVSAILRRSGLPTRAARLEFDDLEMDEDAHLVRRAGEVVDLSPTEYKLLRFLLRNAGRVVSRAQILDHVWEYDFGGNSGVVDTFISSLRKKVDRGGPPLIQTVRGVGYAIRAE